MAKKGFYVDIRLQCYHENHEEVVPKIVEVVQSGKAKIECLHYGGDRYVLKIKGEIDAP